jgi:D-alanyl-D-alanine dipeptidase
VNGLLLALALLAAPAAPAGAAQLVDVAQAVPRAVLEMRYATPDNFLHRAVYQHPRCLLRPEVAAALGRVEAGLEKQGYRLKLWDCYRPLSVQREMWKLVPVVGLVADPNKGGSHHNRGTAVDASLVDLEGQEVAICSGHDDFTPKGRRDAPCDKVPAKHRAALRAAMEAEGFMTIKTEWWHYDAPGSRTPPLPPALDEPL